MSLERMNPFKQSCEIKGWKRRSIFKSIKQSACRYLKFPFGTSKMYCSLGMEPVCR